MVKNNNKSTHYRRVRKSRRPGFISFKHADDNPTSHTLMLYVSRKVQDTGIFKQDVSGGELCLVYKKQNKIHIGKCYLRSSWLF